MPERRKAGWILAGLFLFEGYFVAASAAHGPAALLRSLGFLPGPHAAAFAGWLASGLVAALYIALSLRLPSVRTTMFTPGGLKWLALGLAVAAGILEEAVFRSILMNALQSHGYGAIVQVTLSGLSFGAMHAVWALFRGSWRAGLGAMAATGSLGVALALVFLAGGRSLAPCISAHFLINALCEPGLVLAAVRGEMGGAAA